MNQRTNQGGSVVVYSIVGLVLALAAVGSIYAVQQRADGEQIGPMVAVQQDEKEQKPAENQPSEQKTDEAKQQSEQKAAEEKKAQEEAAVKQQAAEEEKAKRQQQEAAQQKATEQKAAELKAAQQRAADEKKAQEQQRAAGAAPAPAQTPTQPLPQTGPADMAFAGAVLAILSIAIIRYAFSHKFVTGK